MYKWIASIFFIIGCSELNRNNICECKDDVQTETKPEQLGWYSDDCEIQRMNVRRAVDHYKRGLITKEKGRSIRIHRDKVCGYSTTK